MAMTLEATLKQPILATPPIKYGRSFYSAKVDDFLRSDSETILGRLSQGQLAVRFSVEPDQDLAWRREIELLRSAFRLVGSKSENWSILLESPLIRHGKRMDVVILAPGIIAIVEFKIGGKSYEISHRVQTERYANLLHDFHEASQSRLIVPILCSEQAPSQPIAICEMDGVTSLIQTNAKTLGLAFQAMAERSDRAAAYLGAGDFDYSPYCPTPTIVEAAQALYAGHQIEEIGRGDAAAQELNEAGQLLQAIAKEAEQKLQRVICFVTGAPGAGKTLLGLDLALKSRSGKQPAALLSGNRPLVHVLTEALAADSAARLGVTKEKAKYEAEAAIQNLLGYLKEHTDGATPPEHVIVFDEAQRAWDQQVGEKLMGRPASEPELF